MQTTAILLISIFTFFIVGCTGTLRTGTALDEADDQRSTATPDTAGNYAPLQIEELAGITPESPGFGVNSALFETKPCPPMEQPSGKNNQDTSTTESLVTISGYRIQLFAGREQRLAHSIKKSSEIQFKLPIYLIYEAPQYKIRLGDFATRDEASEFCQQVRDKGYRDAWVVKSKVQIYR